MQYTIFTVLATAASFASAQSSSSAASASPSLIGAVVPVGGDCVPGGTMCALGSQCYATNSMLQPRCGNFQAACTSNQQCAFNTCNNGLCNGFLSSSSISASPTVTTTPTGGFSPAPSPTVTAAPGTLPLGAECNPFVKPEQCIAGVQCWASNSGLIPRCGNFNAACTSDSQCAYNTCNNGLCNGFRSSSSASGNSTMSASSSGSVRPSGSSSASASRTASGSASVSASGTVSRSASGTVSGSASRTSSMTQFTGAAAMATMVPEVMAMVLGVAAWAL
ncbi:hypothetical protein OPT61_g364 [Boeremia exigua]|uniref:Uncharacterized protein n=1 Tax=Boeremia exigua TaxID=749465 RepID=A0ACC2IU26_9PLEO|nr:hypothetical protein OPT61_g364 [Boeremia exigua]